MSDKTVEREHFAFLKSYWEQIKLLPSKKQKCEVFEAILSVQFFEKEISSISFSSQNQMILWEGLKPILKQSQKGYIDKMGLQGQNPSQGATQAPPQHKDKEEDKDKESEREGESSTTSKNIYFSLSENELLKEKDEFIKYLISTEERVPNESGFRRTIKTKFEKNDKIQLEEFERWYITKTCEEYAFKYNQKYYIGNIKITSIHSYFNTKGYESSNFNQNHKFIMQLEDDSTHEFSNKKELDKYLINAEYQESNENMENHYKGLDKDIENDFIPL